MKHSGLKQPHGLARDQEDEITLALNGLGKMFNLYRGQLDEYVIGKTKDEWGNQMIAKNLGVDEQTHLLNRFSKLFQNPSSIELFHKKAVGLTSDFLAKDPDFFSEEDPLVDEQESLIKKLNIVTGDKIQHMMVKISERLSKKLESLSLALIRLYEEEELEMIIKERRVRGLKKLMAQGRYIKMDLQNQIKNAEIKRKEIMEALTYMTDPNPSNSASRNSAEDYLSEYLKKYSDKKDLIYTLFEDNMLDYMVDDITEFYKTNRMNTFQEHLKILPYTLYLRDYAFSVDRYFTNFMVKGSCYISSKKSLSHTREDGLISINMLEQVCRFMSGNPHNLQKYASNQSFDNITVALDTIDILYCSYTCLPPKLLLSIKNLFGAYMDEVDNSDNLVYENPLDIPLTLMKRLGEQLRKDVINGVFGSSRTSIVTMEQAHVKRSDFIAAIYIKFDTERRFIDSTKFNLQLEVNKVFQVQSKYLEYFDYEDIEKLVVYNETRFKLKEKSNPNQIYLDHINNLRPQDIIKVKKIPQKFLSYENYKFEGTCPKSMIVHPEMSTIVESLMANDQGLLRERCEVYCAKRSEECGSKESPDTDPTKLAEVGQTMFTTCFYSMQLLSRNHIIRMLSYMNYFRSVSLSVARRNRAVSKMQANIEMVEQLRFANMQGFLKRKDESQELTVRDDSQTDTFRKKKPARRNSFAEEDEFDEYEMGPAANVGADRGTHRERTLLEMSELEVEEKGTCRPGLDDFEKGEVPTIKDFKKVWAKNYYRDRLHTFKLKIKDNEVFDDCQFIQLGENFMLEPSSSQIKSSHLYIKVTDHLEQEIVYDKALEDLEDLLEEIKKISSFYLQNSLVDFCFDSVVTTELISNDLKDKDSSLNHVRFETKSSVHHINCEYIINEVLRHECDFQMEKARAIEIHMRVIENSPESFNKTKAAILNLIKWRPEFDFQNREILTETINEICNSKTNSSSISTKDVCKEIQNFIVTIFDHYRSAIKYLQSLGSLMEDIYIEQKRLWDHTDVLTDLRHRESVARKRIRKFLDTIDNLAKLSTLHEDVSQSVETMVESLLPLQAIDANSMADFTIEENKQTYFKTMQVKYMEGMTNTNVLGKGIKESTYIYFLRLHLQNRLMNRVGFIQGNLRLTVIDELRHAWSQSCNSVSSRLTNYQEIFSPEFALRVQFDPHVEDKEYKSMKDLYYAMDNLIKSHEDEKKSHIYAVHEYVNRRGLASFSKSKSIYTKNDWRHKVSKLNPTFATYYLFKYQFGMRNSIAALEPLLVALTHQNNLRSTRVMHRHPNEIEIGRMIESLLNFKDVYNLNCASVQKLLQYKVLNKNNESEDPQKRGTILGDSKFIFEFTTLFRELATKGVQSSCLQWTDFLSNIMHDVGKIVSNTTVANTLITSIGVYLDPNAPAEIVITDQNHTLITSVEKNEIILGSENESIVRRLVLQLIMDHSPELKFDLMSEIKTLKKDLGSRYHNQIGMKS